MSGVACAVLKYNGCDTAVGVSEGLVVSVSRLGQVFRSGDVTTSQDGRGSEMGGLGNRSARGCLCYHGHIDRLRPSLAFKRGFGWVIEVWQLTNAHCTRATIAASLKDSFLGHEGTQARS